MIPTSFSDILNNPTAYLDFQGNSLAFLDSTTNSVVKMDLAAKMLHSLSKEKLETIYENPPEIQLILEKTKYARIKQIPTELQERAKTMNVYTTEVNGELTKTQKNNPLSTRRLWPLQATNNSSSK